MVYHVHMACRGVSWDIIIRDTKGAKSGRLYRKLVYY